MMNSHYICSFCGSSQLEAKKIVAKGNKDEPAICSVCVSKCVDILINSADVTRLNAFNGEADSSASKLRRDDCDTKELGQDYPLQRRLIHKVDKVPEDMLLVAHGMLPVIKSELKALGVEPTPAHIRWLFSVIEGVLLSD